MSVPKRFRTKTQKTVKITPHKVLIKTNSIVQLDKYLMFLNFEKSKKINQF